MKSLTILLCLFISSNLFACPDFSGEFYDENDGTYFTMTQNSCESITYNFEEGPITRPLDGIEYLVNQYDIIVLEGKILATVKIYSKNKFSGEKLLTIDRSETIYAKNDTEQEIVKTETHLDKNNNLVAVSTSRDGKKTKIINKRVH